MKMKEAFIILEVVFHCLSMPRLLVHELTYCVLAEVCYENVYTITFIRLSPFR